jgi:hypothetical protein
VVSSRGDYAATGSLIPANPLPARPWNAAIATFKMVTATHNDNGDNQSQNGDNQG